MRGYGIAVLVWAASGFGAVWLAMTFEAYALGLIVMVPPLLPAAIFVWLVVGVTLLAEGIRVAWRARSPTPTAVGIGALPLMVIGSCGLVAATARHPSDAQMMKELRVHRAEFETLLAMFEQDRGVGRIAPDFVLPNTPTRQRTTLPPERLANYRRRFEELDLVAGIEGYGDKSSVHFYRSTMGLSISGSIKGFAYLKKPPEGLVSGNVQRRPHDHAFSNYRHVEGRWYLYYHYDD